MSEVSDHEVVEFLRSAVSGVNPADRWDEVRGGRSRGVGGPRLLAVAAGLLALGLGVWGIGELSGDQVVSTTPNETVPADGRSTSSVTTASGVIISLAPLGPEPEFDPSWLGEEVVVERDIDLGDLGYLEGEITKRVEKAGGSVHGLEIVVLGRVEGNLSYRYSYATDPLLSLAQSCWHRGLGDDVADLCGEELERYYGPMAPIDLGSHPERVEMLVSNFISVVSLSQDGRHLWQRPVGDLVFFPADSSGAPKVASVWTADGTPMDSIMFGHEDYEGDIDGEQGVVLIDAGGIEIAESVATPLGDMIAAAADDGVVLRGNGFRPLFDQWMKVYDGNCGRAAEDGLVVCEHATTSVYAQMATQSRGLAVDFFTVDDGSDREISVDDPEYQWLVDNAANFGFFNNECCSDPWHWSVNGN